MKEVVLTDPNDKALISCAEGSTFNKVTLPSGLVIDGPCIVKNGKLYYETKPKQKSKSWRARFFRFVQRFEP